MGKNQEMDRVLLDREWLEKTVCHHFPALQDRIPELLKAPELLHFAHTGEAPLFLVSTNQHLVWKSKLDVDSFDGCIAFYKQPNGMWSAVSLGESMVESLYSTIHGIYNPLLIK
jgi:hypothetical protein